MDKTLRTYFSISLRPFIPNLVILALLMLVTTTLALLTPWPLKILIDNILGGEILPANTLLGHFLNTSNSLMHNALLIALAYLSLNIVDGVFNYLEDILTYHTSQEIGKKSAHYLLSKIGTLSQQYLDEQDRGGLLYKLSNNTSAVADITLSVIFPLIKASVFFLMTLLILTRIDTTMTLVAIASLVPMLLNLYIQNSKIANNNSAIQTLNTKLYGFIESLLAQLTEIRLYQKLQTFLKFFHAKWYTTQKAEEHLYQRVATIDLTNGFVTVLAYAVLIWLGVQKFETGQITTGILIVFLTYFGELLPPVFTFINAITDWQDHYSRINATSSLLVQDNQQLDNGTIADVTDTTVCINNLTLNLRGRQLFTSANLSFPKSGLYFIIGASGTGKSTLFNLMLRLIPLPKDSHITIGGQSVVDYTLNTLYSTLTLVPQSSILPGYSVQDVLTFLEPHRYSKVELEKALKQACLTRVISSLPYGLETVIGVSGQSLSGGERQRLLLARALLKDSPILLLDEIFASQDPKLRRELLTSLRHLAKTKLVIITTHNLELISPNDNVYSIQDQQIIKSSHKLGRR